MGGGGRQLQQQPGMAPGFGMSPQFQGGLQPGTSPEDLEEVLNVTRSSAGPNGNRRARPNTMQLNDQLRKLNRGSNVEAIMNSLASVAGSFNPRKGAELQDIYGRRATSGLQRAQQQRQGLLDRAMPQGAQAPTSVKEYQHYLSTVPPGSPPVSFLEWVRGKVPGGGGQGPQDPRMADVQGRILDQMLQQLGGAPGNAGAALGGALGGGGFATPPMLPQGGRPQLQLPQLPPALQPQANARAPWEDIGQGMRIRF